MEIFEVVVWILFEFLGGIVFEGLWHALVGIVNGIRWIVLSLYQLTRKIASPFPRAVARFRSPRRSTPSRPPLAM